eukprot:1485934-Rhodomonas_salina.1
MPRPATAWPAGSAFSQLHTPSPPAGTHARTCPSHTHPRATHEERAARASERKRGARTREREGGEREVSKGARGLARRRIRAHACAHARTRVCACVCKHASTPSDLHPTYAEEEEEEGAHQGLGEHACVGVGVCSVCARACA